VNLERKIRSVNRNPHWLDYVGNLGPEYSAGET